MNTLREVGSQNKMQIICPMRLSPCSFVCDVVFFFSQAFVLLSTRNWVVPKDRVDRPRIGERCRRVLRVSK